MTQYFHCTNSKQVYIVPEGINSLYLQAFGASGGFLDPTPLTIITGDIENGEPGKGGMMAATLRVNPGDVLEIFVGCQGASSFETSKGGRGGFGMQPGGDTIPLILDDSIVGTSAGGGSSGIVYGIYRFIAAGGGGMGFYYTISTPKLQGMLKGGDGGWPKGEDGEKLLNAAGLGATQEQSGAGSVTNGMSGSPSKGGDTGITAEDASKLAGAGGGGGYRGGGGGAYLLLPDIARVNAYSIHSAGGGGASYFESPFLLSTFENGVQSGDGLVIVTSFKVTTTLSHHRVLKTCPVTNHLEVIGLTDYQDLEATFSVFDKCDVNAGPVFTCAVRMTGSSVTSEPFEPSKPGTYYWIVEVTKAGVRIISTRDVDPQQILQVDSHHSHWVSCFPKLSGSDEE